MDKPEKKEIGGEEILLAEEVIGYNQAIDDYEKYLKGKGVMNKPKKDIKVMLEPNSYGDGRVDGYNAACDDWEEYQNETRQRLDTLQAMYEGLKASNELNKKEMAKEHKLWADLHNQLNNLPNEKEIARIIKDEGICNCDGWNDTLANGLAKAIYRRIQGEK